MIVSKLKNPSIKQQLLFCAKDSKDRDSWINVLKDLNERLIQASKVSANSSSILLVFIDFYNIKLSLKLSYNKILIKLAFTTLPKVWAFQNFSLR